MPTDRASQNPPEPFIAVDHTGVDTAELPHLSIPVSPLPYNLLLREKRSFATRFSLSFKSGYVNFRTFFGEWA